MNIIIIIILFVRLQRQIDIEKLEYVSYTYLYNNIFVIIQIQVSK